MTHVKTMEAAKIMEDVDTMATNQVTAFKEDTLHKKMGIGAEAKSNLTHYCWTHGICAHMGKYFRTPADGHQKYAVWYTKMLGSERN